MFVHVLTEHFIVGFFSCNVLKHSQFSFSTENFEICPRNYKKYEKEAFYALGPFVHDDVHGLLASLFLAYHSGNVRI